MFPYRFDILVLKLIFFKIIYIILIYFQVKYILQNNNTNFLLLYLYFRQKQLGTCSWKLKHISDLLLASSSSVFSLKKKSPPSTK